MRRRFLILFFALSSIIFLGSAINSSYKYSKNTLSSSSQGLIYGDSFITKELHFNKGVVLPLYSKKLTVSLIHNNLLFHDQELLTLTSSGDISYKISNSKSIIYPKVYFFIFLLVFFIFFLRKRYFFFLGLTLLLIIYALLISNVTYPDPKVSNKSELLPIEKMLDSFTLANDDKLFNQDAGCHGELHNLGAFYYRAGFSLDEMIKPGNSNICAGGFIHGALEEAGKISSNFDELLVVVESGCLAFDKKYHDPLWLDNCLHSSGHSFFYFENGVLATSMEDCDSFTLDKVKYACQKGVFMSFSNALHSKERVELLNRNNLSSQDGVKACDGFDDDIFCQELIYSYLTKGDIGALGLYLNNCKMLKHASECEFGIGIIAFQNYIFKGKNDFNLFKAVCDLKINCLEGMLHADALDKRFHGDTINNIICTKYLEIKNSACLNIYKNAYEFEPPHVVINS
jgi:hypothetical protein